jgi:hypothetical protein
MAGKVARLGEISGRPEKHGRVAVVPTSVHDALILRSVRLPGRFLDRKGVHIGAKPYRSTLAPPMNDTYQPGTANTGHHLIDTEAFQLLDYGRRRLMNVIL